MIKKGYKLVYGAGVKGVKYNSKCSGKTLREYFLWQGVLFRCTQKFWSKRQSYVGYTMSENFKSYTFFYEWCQSQIGFKNKDENGRCWEIDKDLLGTGNKAYSEDTCVFVPQRINSLLIKCDSARGEYPVGVSWKKDKNKFVAQCRLGGSKRKFLGYFLTAQEAFLAYKTFKEALIKEVANEYRTQIDPRAYNALMKYKVDEND